MKQYIYDRKTKKLYESVRSAERDLGCTLTKMQQDEYLVILNTRQITDAIQQYLYRGRENGAASIRKPKSRAMEISTETQNIGDEIRSETSTWEANEIQSEGSV